MQDVEKVLAATAACKDLKLMMQGLQVASKLIACNAGWLERERDVTWAALWRGLAKMDKHHFREQPVPDVQGAAVGSIECALPSDRISQSLHMLFSDLYAMPQFVDDEADHRFRELATGTPFHCSSLGIQT